MGATAEYSGLSGTNRTGRPIVSAAGEAISRRISFLGEQSRGDPRLLQILFLGVLLAAGAWFRDFSIHPIQIVLTFATAVGCQGLLGRITGQNPISWRSAFITALGISLLLRADNWWAHPAAASAAIGSKFAIRLRGKHLFNPANFGVILVLIFIPGTWVSPGQWGQDVAAAGWLVALGAVVTHRARRGDISWSFLILYLGAIAMRVWWLGQNWPVWVHQFGNGALLLFAFFMISDPMTIPNHWRGRIAHAALVTVFAYVWQFDFYRTNGLLWALFALAPAVPLWDRLWPAQKFEWASAQGGMNVMNPKTYARASRVVAAILMCAFALIAMRAPALAFCGFYVGKADTGLYNHASQVAYVRHEDKNVISIMNDYQGEPTEFALVVPVPVVLQKDQIHIGNRELFQRLDAYSSPRLVEYYDPDPCARQMLEMGGAMNSAKAMAGPASMAREDRSLGVTIEAQYTVGEYDIVILSATQSGGLETWLQSNGYHIPFGASRALQPYIRQNMKFFVAKVNLKELERSGLSYLRPIQFAFDSHKFMLPIRLGMINSQGPQDLVIYILTESGRVETTNYRTVKVPTGMDLPQYIRDDFGSFYKAMFDRQVMENDMKVVFTEYVWNMGFCDPCAAPPLSQDELRQLGVFWLDAGRQAGIGGGPMPFEQVPVMLTRLHVRYSAATFPEDLTFQETQDQENFQGRYVLRHPWAGSEDTCPAAKGYFDDLRQRRTTEAATLADLTGWNLDEIYQKAGYDPGKMPKPSVWWNNLWR